MAIPPIDPAHDEPSSPLSPVAARLLARAHAELQSGNADAAQRTLENVLALAPDDAAALHELGALAYHRGDYATSIRCFRKLVVARPEDTNARVWLGIALQRNGSMDEAIEHLRRACTMSPDSAVAWYNLGEAARTRGHSAEAVAALKQVLLRDPADTQAMISLARTEAGMGHIDAAVAELREILRREPDNAEIWFELSNLKAVRFGQDELAHLETAFQDHGVAANSRIWFGFVLARALEDNNEYARAFHVLEEANALQRANARWDGVAEHVRVEAIRRAWDASPLASRPQGPGSGVIFIGCLPRSGSTLVEQILASHPEVEGANETKVVRGVINEETTRRGVAFPLWVPAASSSDWLRMGNEYLARTHRWRARKPRFTDKSLGNWMLLGAALAMLPAARAIICRRDPVETCLACYRQWFAQAAAFTNDLDEMAAYCIDFMRLTRFWLGKFPDRVFDLEYETLVAEPEPTIRRLLDFCGLPFDRACLEFYRTERTVLSLPSAAQVRQPLQRNTARAAHYGHLLDPLRRRLRDGGLQVGDI